MRRRPSQIGVAPTQAQKLQHVSNGLGIPGIAGMQGSTVFLYDTVNLATGTGRQKLTFFSQTANKSKNFTNFQAQMLKSGESMIISELSFIVLELSGTNLNDDATAVQNAYPIQATPNGIIPNQAALTLGTIGINIANSTTVKYGFNYESDPAFNPKTTGMAVYDTATATNVRVGGSKVFLEAPPAFPPNQSLEITLEIGPTGTVAANTAVMLVIGRFGSIFAGKQTY